MVSLDDKLSVVDGDLRSHVGREVLVPAHVVGNIPARVIKPVEVIVPRKVELIGMFIPAVVLDPVHLGVPGE